MVNMCSCGLAAGRIYPKFDKLRGELKKEKPSSWTTIDLIREIIGFDLPSMQDKCGLDMKEQEELLNSAKDHIIDGEWNDAFKKIFKADSDSWDKLLRCAERG